MDLAANTSAPSSLNVHSFFGWSHGSQEPCILGRGQEDIRLHGGGLSVPPVYAKIRIVTSDGARGTRPYLLLLSSSFCMLSHIWIGSLWLSSLPGAPWDVRSPCKDKFTRLDLWTLQDHPQTVCGECIPCDRSKTNHPDTGSSLHCLVYFPKKKAGERSEHPRLPSSRSRTLEHFCQNLSGKTIGCSDQVRLRIFGIAGFREFFFLFVIFLRTFVFFVKMLCKHILNICIYTCFLAFSLLTVTKSPTTKV